MFARSKWSLILVFTALALFLAACAQVPDITALLPRNDTAVATQPVVAQRVTASEEQILIDLYQRLIPGVVNVQVLQRGDGNRAIGGAGSGFVFDRDGHIVTNAHVVRDAELVDVVLYNDTIVPAEVVGLDDDSDLAVLKVDVSLDQLTPLSLGDSDGIVPGQRVIAIGNPFGQQGSMTFGIVSAVGRTIPSLTPFSIPQAIQTDAAINPGNSGGPLLDLQGKVIGVNAQIESSVRANSGVGFAIPANVVQRVVPVLIEEGEFIWPWLGVEGTSLTPRVAEANELTIERGAYIVAVSSNGPAASAGLQGAEERVLVDGLPIPGGGDVVLVAEDQPIHSMDDLILFISQQEVGGQVTLAVLRDGEEIKVTVTLAARPEYQ